MTSITSKEIRPSGGVLLLGATGRLGGMLRRHWPQAGDLLCQSRRAMAGFAQFDLPLPGQPPSDAALRAAEGVRAIICLSGVTPAAARNGQPMSDNTTLATAALDLAQAAGVSRVLIASSAAVYGAGKGAMSETQAVTPLSDYGRAKLAMEQAVLARGAGIARILRIGNVAGADAILGGWRPGMALDQFADGRTPRRSYIGPVTLARVMHGLCGSADLPDVLNIAAPGVVEMGALLDAAGLAWQPRPAGAESIAKVELDTNALERLVPFAPENTSPAGLVGEWQQDRQNP
ncbi:NAD(P)-dependent oxidoreductase [Sulfitobacter sp. S0837]|uniref:NAD-dependent epimerase/dehydratase family protein n=1 Tax=Sulfitobacter maritimus TaxID=2741719 RepID=UPI0015830637|nr:NAD(P)-dependent oxidoreductase [Sulfitobacter maritimus]NUH67090.1 NAD(P)-dependent oxidoreductase [Sulfitobacter maritimus]